MNVLTSTYNIWGYIQIEPIGPMNIATFEDSTDTPEQICWHNLVTADQKLNLQLFIAAALLWLKLNPASNFTDLELLLRKHNLNTHLIAVTPTQLSCGYKLASPNPSSTNENDDNVYKYVCIYSCRPKEFALQELLTHWPTYDENLANLKFAGLIVLDRDRDNDALLSETSTNNRVVLFNNEQQHAHDQITSNKRKVKIETISATDYFEREAQLIQEKYSQQPSLQVVAMGHNGGPIVAFFINQDGNDIRCSDVSYHIYYDDHGSKLIRLVNV